MFRISASQIRAARGLLHWTQDEMAEKAKVSRATVQTIENGDQEDGTGKKSIRESKLKAIYKTLGDHGIEFLEGDGVRRRLEGYKEFMGPECCDEFFGHILKTIKEKGGNLICSIDHQDILTKKTCSTERSNIERLSEVHEIADVECIISDKLTPPLILPSFPVRVLREEPGMIPTCSFAYGDELAVAFYNESRELVYAIFQRISWRRHFQIYFLPRWQTARPLLIATPVEQKKQRIGAYA